MVFVSTQTLNGRVFAGPFIIGLLALAGLAKGDVELTPVLSKGLGANFGTESIICLYISRSYVTTTPFATWSAGSRI